MMHKLVPLNVLISWCQLVWHIRPIIRGELHLNITCKGLNLLFRKGEMSGSQGRYTDTLFVHQLTFTVICFFVWYWVQVETSGSSFFKEVPPKTTNGIFEFAEALIECWFVFVCLWAVTGTTQLIELLLFSFLKCTTRWIARNNKNFRSVCLLCHDLHLSVCTWFLGALTKTLCRPVRLGDSQSSWVSDTVNMQGFSPIITV